MGSGKTYTSLLCAAALPSRQSARIKVTVICDVSLIGHWTKEIMAFHTPPGKRFQFNIVSYSQLEKRIRLDAVNEITKRVDLVIVDECQRYRHLSSVMLPQVNAIRSCNRVLLLSGTPIVNGAEDTVGFCYLSVGDADAPLSDAASRRCLVYSPRAYQDSENTIRRQTTPRSLWK
ncbi:P-loop containing nucleoside triphosphate hydrolase protein [Tribonema minus]|uniref:P-loop containing nucleoside triphosphate hydrolase protein n=1 Tax=Tribonema minus TaxID=303371 RepID=A0A835Z2M2_9STRA|nr:P-loop containing nucleoside triphosphate hydrolase protein [Tribonema minus]